MTDLEASRYEIAREQVNQALDAFEKAVDQLIDAGHELAWYGTTVEDETGDLLLIRDLAHRIRPTTRPLVGPRIPGAPRGGDGR